MTHAKRLFEIAQSLVDEWPDFFQKKGPGAGDRDTHAFMRELRARAMAALGRDYYEPRICEGSGFKPDFYFPEEAAFVEIAMGFRNPASEYERDIFKAILAQNFRHRVRELIFFAKPGALARFAQPGHQAIAEWVRRTQRINVCVVEFSPKAEEILEPASEGQRP
ncbi:MAG: hypothetical protein ACRD2G_06080 [Terriglobia bacterium]